MSKAFVSLLSMLGLAIGLAASSPATAQVGPNQFESEPDKTMAAANEAFLKGNMNKAAEDISKAVAYVGKQVNNVAKGSKEGVKKAGDALAKLGKDVKQGTVKSGDDLKKTFAAVDHALAKAWHATAEQAKKSNKDSTAALKKAGGALAGAAKWSGTQLQEGAQASVDAVKKVGTGAGKGVKAGADDVDKWFKGIGEGIDDVGRKL